MAALVADRLNVRARNLKPGFFQNEQLAELPYEARLLFAGLWCLADREGRLEDRPKRIKMHVFPADLLDVEPLLAGLAAQGLIRRYEAEGIKCIWIPSFLAHQRPHSKEAQSVLPMFHEEPKTPTKAGASTDLGTCEPALNPSSLNPSSLNALSSRETRARARASKRCPTEFTLTPEMRAWASEKFPGVKVDAETEAFCDHEFKNAHSDWPATWRTWIRNAAKFASSANGASKPEQQRRPTRYEQIFGKEDVIVGD